MTIRSLAATTVLVTSCLLPGRASAQGVDPRPANDPNQKPAHAGQTDAPEKKSSVAFDVVTVAEGLQNPWGVAFLPDGKMLITERPGRLRVVTARGLEVEEAALLSLLRSWRIRRSRAAA